MTFVRPVAVVDRLGRVTKFGPQQYPARELELFPDGYNMLGFTFVVAAEDEYYVILPDRRLELSTLDAAIMAARILATGDYNVGTNASDNGTT